MDTTVQVRPLHLHTVETLCADLVSGRAVGVGSNGEQFALASDHARSVLQWYVANRQKWTGNVMGSDCELIADSIDKAPVAKPELPYTAGAKAPRLWLAKLQAHRFAGLHRYRTASKPPADFELEFPAPITFLEGANGAGKTSVLNAIVWALTGQLFRPQRAPEPGTTEFDAELDPAQQGADATTFKVAAVVPLPDLELERPQGNGLVDTWVELHFKDESGNTVPPVRRAVSRNQRGKLIEDVTGLDTLGVDPVSLLSGTTMPALLPYIEFDGASPLGKAVAELTGLSPLADLNKHATRAAARLLKESTNERRTEIQTADTAFNRSRDDLVAQVAETASLAFPHTLPLPSDEDVEEGLKKTREHFEKLSADRLTDAKEVLGESFDPQQDKQKRDLQDSIAPALAGLGHIKDLPSAARLSALGAVSAEERQAAIAAVQDLLGEAASLVKVAEDGSRAARVRLYAAVSSWMAQHPEFKPAEESCPVCLAPLNDAADPVTGKSVRSHLDSAGHSEAQLVAQTLVQWASAAVGKLTAAMPAAIQNELKRDLPGHPSELIRDALSKELWTTAPFKGVLSTLKDATALACDESLRTAPALPLSQVPADLSSALPELPLLQQAVARVGRAVQFSAWRAENQAFMGEVFPAVLGKPSDPAASAEKSLAGKLHKLQVIVDSVGPIKLALQHCERMEADCATRKAKEARIGRYVQVAQALRECAELGTLAQQQVAQLQEQLKAQAVEWRNRIYLGAFPATHLNLLGLQIATNGKLEFKVGGAGVKAPAQHVSNASALRASLTGFYLAYWSYLQRERGGLQLLILDDPQELLDVHNRNRLAEALVHLAREKAQLVVTTHDPAFAQMLVVAAKTKSIRADHREVHPPSNQRPTLHTSPSLAQVERAYQAAFRNENDPYAAREYASECRVFIEARLGDFFDDAVAPATSLIKVDPPTLMDHVNRLRSEVNGGANELFRSPAIKKLAKDPALDADCATLKLLNAAHHRTKHLIQPGEVHACRGELERLRGDVEVAHEQFRMFMRRERLPTEFDSVPSLEVGELPAFNVPIQPNLLAFVRDSATGETQEQSTEVLDQSWFQDKAFFYLRNGNFGFASTVESVAIVEAIPSAVPDRQLVIARRGKDVFARRLLRPEDSDHIALASETFDPRQSKATVQYHQKEVALHKVVGMLFHVGPLAGKYKANTKSSDEAVRVDGREFLGAYTSAFRVEEQSAVPLALPGQIALGGPRLSPSDYDSHIDKYAALRLDDGTTIFKRIGASLRSPLSHVRQFETIGGLGVADILAVGKPEQGFQRVESAVLVLGVLYHG
jgi:hypothetical protein